MQNITSEFAASFGNYVRDDADEREQMLASFVESCSPEQFVAFAEPHDFAAQLSAVAFVDSTSSVALRAVAAFEEGELFDAEELRSALVVDGNKPHVSTVLEQLVQVDGGNAFLHAVVVCLAEAHQLEGIRVDLWNPNH